MKIVIPIYIYNYASPRGRKTNRIIEISDFEVVFDDFGALPLSMLSIRILRLASGPSFRLIMLLLYYMES